MRGRLSVLGAGDSTRVRTKKTRKEKEVSRPYIEIRQMSELCGGRQRPRGDVSWGGDGRREGFSKCLSMCHQTRITERSRAENCSFRGVGRCRRGLHLKFIAFTVFFTNIFS